MRLGSLKFILKEFKIGWCINLCRKLASIWLSKVSKQKLHLSLLTLISIWLNSWKFWITKRKKHFLRLYSCWQISKFNDFLVLKLKFWQFFNFKVQISNISNRILQTLKVSKVSKPILVLQKDFESQKLSWIFCFSQINDSKNS